MLLILQKTQAATAFASHSSLHLPQPSPYQVHSLAKCDRPPDQVSKKRIQKKYKGKKRIKNQSLEKKRKTKLKGKEESLVSLWYQTVHFRKNAHSKRPCAHCHTVLFFLLFSCWPVLFGWLDKGVGWLYIMSRRRRPFPRQPLRPAHLGILLHPRLHPHLRLLQHSSP